MTLGELKKVDIRKQWKNEAIDFTPWLADNIEKISDIIGLELEFEGREVSAGSFSADILAKDENGKYVIIENQYSKTDHDHLGKCITYASTLDASTIIWIAEDFREEHKKAFDWLNDLTNKDISFFAVKLELLQIDNSKYAVNFDVVSGPNQNVRNTRKTVGGELSALQLVQIEFWDDFKEKIHDKNKRISLQTARPQNWFDITIGKSGIHVFNTRNQLKNQVTTGIYIRSTIADKMLPYLENRKEKIEKEMGQKLIWNPNPDNREKKIMLSYSADLKDSEEREKALDWLCEISLKFVKVFTPIVKSFNN